MSAARRSVPASNWSSSPASPPRPSEPVAARWFQAASPATVRVWVMPRAGHTQGLATAPGAWEAHVIGFLNAALKP